MGDVIYVDFNKKNIGTLFQAEIYTGDRKKYKFQISADNVTQAYYASVAKSYVKGIETIRCLALYRGADRQIHRTQAPEKVWNEINGSVVYSDKF